MITKFLKLCYVVVAGYQIGSSAYVCKNILQTEPLYDYLDMDYIFGANKSNDRQLQDKDKVKI